VFLRDRSTALSFGEVRFGTKGGVLVLAPSYPLGGMLGDHLIFYWKSGGVDYMVTLHSWEPFLQTVATLRALVISTAAARPTK
jgi:hypothetical protein